MSMSAASASKMTIGPIGTQSIFPPSRPASHCPCDTQRRGIISAEGGSIAIQKNRSLSPNGGINFIAIRSTIKLVTVPIMLAMNANLSPRRLRKLHIIVPRGRLDVRERQVSISIGDVYNLTEPRDSVAYVLGIGQRLFPLVRKGINPSGKSLCAVSRPCFS